MLPYFTPYHDAEWPIVVEADLITSIDDIHTIKEEHLEITYPDPHQHSVLYSSGKACRDLGDIDHPGLAHPREQ